MKNWSPPKTRNRVCVFAISAAAFALIMARWGWTSAEHVSCFFEIDRRLFKFVWPVIGCQLLKYIVVNYIHARCMKWTRYFLSYCSLVSMFLSLAKCFLLLCCLLHILIWVSNDTWFLDTASRQRHTALLGTVVQHLDCVRGDYMILPPVPVRYIISISIRRNQQYLHNKSYARANHCQSRKKFFPCHLLQFFMALCHAFSLSSLQGLKKISTWSFCCGHSAKGHTWLVYRVIPGDLH